MGNRELFEEMLRAIETCKINPVLDSKVFAFDDADVAFKYMAQGYQWWQSYYQGCLEEFESSFLFSKPDASFPEQIWRALTCSTNTLTVPLPYLPHR